MSHEGEKSDNKVSVRTEEFSSLVFTAQLQEYIHTIDNVSGSGVPGVGRMDIDCLPSRATPGKQPRQALELCTIMRLCVHVIPIHTQQWNGTVRILYSVVWVLFGSN